MYTLENAGWQGAAALEQVEDFVCGYCGREVGATLGYTYKGARGLDPRGAAVVLALCPRCAHPTLLEEKKRQVPLRLPGRPVEHLPESVALLFLEARLCISAGAYTGSVLLCRKIIVFVAFRKGAGVGRSFFYYVNFLAQANYLPPNSFWPTYVQTRSNEAAHELSIMDLIDAQAMLGFTETLLRFIYELPHQLPLFVDSGS